MFRAEKICWLDLRLHLRRSAWLEPIHGILAFRLGRVSGGFGERLLEIGNDVVDMFCTDRNADEVLQKWLESIYPNT